MCIRDRLRGVLRSHVLRVLCDLIKDASSLLRGTKYYSCGTQWVYKYMAVDMYVLFLYSTKYDPESWDETENEHQMWRNLTNETENNSLDIRNETDREFETRLTENWISIKMRLVNEKQKRVSELKGISATSLREKDTDGHCKWMSKMLAWPRFRHVCYDVYVRNEWHW